eukprot:13804881-Alexandrium_andersonii.AAC.1
MAASSSELEQSPAIPLPISAPAARRRRFWGVRGGRRFRQTGSRKQLHRAARNCCELLAAQMDRH